MKTERIVVRISKELKDKLTKLAKSQNRTLSNAIESILIKGTALLVFSFGLSSFSTSVRGYIKKNGTFVKPHLKTKKNKTKLDNYSYEGNVNPITLKPGSQK